MASNYDQVLTELVKSFGDWFGDEKTLEYARMTRELYPYTHLFSPIQVNSVKIKNRIVMGPMGNIQMADELGRPSNKMMCYFAERAKGGVGLITSGIVPVSQYVDPSVTEPGERTYLPRIDTRTVFTGWRDLAGSVHAHGAKFFIQLTPGLGRVGSPKGCQTATEVRTWPHGVPSPLSQAAGLSRLTAPSTSHCAPGFLSRWVTICLQPLSTVPLPIK